LFVAECPDVRFDDVLSVSVSAPDTWVLIDFRFLEVCEPGSVQVCSCVPDVPVLVGAAVDGDRVRVRLGPRDTADPVRLVIRLTGIRKGFRGQRFPDRTRDDFDANERFLRSAHPGPPR
jgi:hypothetical protein